MLMWTDTHNCVISSVLEGLLLQSCLWLQILISTMLREGPWCSTTEHCQLENWDTTHDLYLLFRNGCYSSEIHSEPSYLG